MWPVIGLSGKVGSGKSTAAAILCRLLAPCEERSVAAALRRVVEVLTGVPAASTQQRDVKCQRTAFGDGLTVGQVLQRVGVGMRQTLDENVWVEALFADPQWRRVVAGELRWVISDVRFPNEADRIRSLGGIVLRLEGDPGGVRARNADGRDLAHSSETSLDQYPHFHAHIDNAEPSMAALEAALRRAVFITPIPQEPDAKKLRRETPPPETGSFDGTK